MVFRKKKKIEDEEFESERPELEHDNGKMLELGDNIPLQINVTPEMPKFSEPKDEFSQSLEAGKNTARCFGCKTNWKTEEDSYQKCPYCGRVGMVKVETVGGRYRSR